jgi:beta-mannosidase
MALISLKPSKWEYAELKTPPQVEGAKWVPCKHFPTEIHWELLDAGKIPDWNIGRAEHEIQWVSKRTWAFRSVIDLRGLDVMGKKVEIAFESLDTFATVYLVRPISPLPRSDRLMIRESKELTIRMEKRSCKPTTTS